MRPQYAQANDQLNVVTDKTLQRISAMHTFNEKRHIRPYCDSLTNAQLLLLLLQRVRPPNE